jgi:hypothetical protein
MAYVVEKGVAAPVGYTKSKYPLEDMAVGDSFFVPDRKSASVRNSVMCRARDVAKRTGGPLMRFSIRTEGSGTRCWRV